jgi:hypothetical protein
MTPVVNRQASRECPFLLALGKPTGGPFRRPLLESLQLFSALANPSKPDEYASLEFSGHQGATSCLARFHSRRSAGSVHGTSMVASDSRSSNRCSTRASPQLNANRAAPQCDASARRCAGLGSNANLYACITVAIGIGPLTRNLGSYLTLRADPDTRGDASTAHRLEDRLHLAAGAYAEAGEPGNFRTNAGAVRGGRCRSEGVLSWHSPRTRGTGSAGLCSRPWWPC